MAAWIPKTAEEAYRRAAGRRRYHAQRQKVQRQRQGVVLAALIERQWRTHGLGREMARKLEVDPATISRDIKTLTNRRALLIERQYPPDIVVSVLRMMTQENPRPIVSSVTITSERLSQAASPDNVQPLASLSVTDFRDEKKEPEASGKPSAPAPITDEGTRPVRKIRFHRHAPDIDTQVIQAYIKDRQTEAERREADSPRPVDLFRAH